MCVCLLTKYFIGPYELRSCFNESLLSCMYIFMWFIIYYLIFKKRFFFLMLSIFKVFIEFVTMLLLFFASVFWSGGMWDLHPLTREEPVPLALEEIKVCV